MVRASQSKPMGTGQSSFQNIAAHIAHMMQRRCGQKHDRTILTRREAREVARALGPSAARCFTTLSRRMASGRRHDFKCRDAAMAFEGASSLYGYSQCLLFTAFWLFRIGSFLYFGENSASARRAPVLKRPA